MSTTLQRVVLPANADTTVLSLYVDWPPRPEPLSGRRYRHGGALVPELMAHLVKHLSATASRDGRPSRPALVAGAACGVARQLFPSPLPDRADSAPEIVLRHEDAYWWRLFSHDSAVVSTADGTRSVHHRRDRRTFLEMLRRNARVHRRLHREWPELAVRYRAALPRLSSPEAWEETFERAGRQA
jgi:hypothetical protein